MAQTPLGRVLAGIRGKRSQVEMADQLTKLLPDRDRPLTKQHVYNWERSTVPGENELRAYCRMAPDRTREIIDLAGLGWVIDMVDNGPTDEAA